MTLKNVNYIRVKDLSEDQKKELGIDVSKKMGLVAREPHNPNYNTKEVLLKKGLVNYVLKGE